MDHFEKIVKKTGVTSLITSIIFALIGILMITNPDGIIKFVSYIIGIIFIAMGIYKMFNYYRNKGKYDIFNYDIAYGIIAIIIGLITMIYCRQITSFYRIIIGIWITYSGIIRLNLSLKLQSIDSRIWLYSLIISICMLLCGLYTIFTSNAILVTIGAIVLFYSVLDIIESIIFIRNTNKLYIEIK